MGRHLFLLWLFILLIPGCASVLDQDALVQRYTQTALTEGVVSAVPRPIDPDNPPVVVNWWYTGSWNRHHYVVYRELTWDASGEPTGRETWYRLREDAFAIRGAFDKTDEVARWLPLYEALPGVIAPPVDLVSRRSIGGPAPLDPTLAPAPLPRPPVSPVPIPPNDERN